MKKSIIALAIASVITLTVSVAVAQERTSPQPRRGSAENSLLGVSLYDTGLKLINRFGSPDEIQGLSTSISTEGGGGAPSTGGGRGGPPPGGGRGGAGGTPTGGGAPMAPPGANIEPADGGAIVMVGDPFEDQSKMWRQQFPEDDERAGRGGGGAPPGGGRGAPGGPPGGRGGEGAVSGSSGRVIFTRWVYKKPGTRYAFVLDKFNRVIQIEAVGMKNSAVRTRRGITLGSSFGALIKAYNAPDAYEINGENIVVRFLVRDRVAFRMSRLQANKPHQVTGVVVAAGKQ